MCSFVALCVSVFVPVFVVGVFVCDCAVQLTSEKDKLKEAQKLIKESEAKVGVPSACVLFPPSAVIACLETTRCLENQKKERIMTNFHNY